MINFINKKNGLRKVMIIVGMCFVLGLFSGCLDLSDETNENQTGNTTENITIPGAQQTILPDLQLLS